MPASDCWINYQTMLPEYVTRIGTWKRGLGFRVRRLCAFVSCNRHHWYSSSAARWIAQLTMNALYVTDVRFESAKGLVLWKVNYNPKLIQTWFACRSCNPIFFSIWWMRKNSQLSCSLKEIPAENSYLLIWKIGNVSLHRRPYLVEESDINMVTISAVNANKM